MTTIEIILISIIWLIVGIWICYKRQWYYDMNANEFFCVLAVLVAPISFIVAFIKVFCIDEWNNE